MHLGARLFLYHSILVRDQRTIEAKACKPFRSEDVINLCITAIVYSVSAGRKAEVLDEYVWAPYIIKEKLNESFNKVCFSMVASLT